MTNRTTLNETVLNYISIWEQGCSNVTQQVVQGRLTAAHPENCPECTLALIQAIKREATASPTPPQSV